MRKKTLALLLLTGALLMNTTPCFAAAQSVKVSVATSSSKSDYPQLPTAETVQKDTGFSPKLPSALAGGFQYESGRITESSTLDANGNVTSSSKGISLKYAQSTNGTAKSVSFNAEPEAGQTPDQDAISTKYGDFTLYYSDKQAYSVSWTDDGVFYMLMDINKTVSRDSLHAMAKEIIDLKTGNQ